MVVLKYEYILIETGSDEILRKMLTVHIYTLTRSYMRNLVNIGLLYFAVARVRTYIHTYGRTRYSVHAIRASPYRSCTKNQKDGI